MEFSDFLWKKVMEIVKHNCKSFKMPEWKTRGSIGACFYRKHTATPLSLYLHILLSMITTNCKEYRCLSDYRKADH